MIRWFARPCVEDISFGMSVVSVLVCRWTAYFIDCGDGVLKLPAFGSVLLKRYAESQSHASMLFAPPYQRGWGVASSFLSSCGLFLTISYIHLYIFLYILSPLNVVMGWTFRLSRICDSVQNSKTHSAGLIVWVIIRSNSLAEWIWIVVRRPRG